MYYIISCVSYDRRQVSCSKVINIERTKTDCHDSHSCATCEREKTRDSLFKMMFSAGLGDFETNHCLSVSSVDRIKV